VLRIQPIFIETPTGQTIGGSKIYKLFLVVEENTNGGKSFSDVVFAVAVALNSTQTLVPLARLSGLVEVSTPNIAMDEPVTIIVGPELCRKEATLTPVSFTLEAVTPSLSNGT
jgi:hypothetical protein